MNGNTRHGVRRAMHVSVASLAVCLAVGALLAAAGCSRHLTFSYPGEALDLALVGSRTPTVYLDKVVDLRPDAQRRGRGHFVTITYPKDDAWEAPATRLYAEALTQDLTQTGLVDLVPLAAGADYVLSAELLSFTCQLHREPTSFLVTALIGGALGYALGGGGGDSAKLAAGMAVVGLAALPVPTDHHAEAEVRLSLRDREGQAVWQKSCLGEVSDRTHETTTSRTDQAVVDRLLTRAVKRADACLVGQLRQFLAERAAATEAGR